MWIDREIAAIVINVGSIPITRPTSSFDTSHLLVTGAN